MCAHSAVHDLQHERSGRVSDKARVLQSCTARLQARINWLIVTATVWFWLLPAFTMYGSAHAQ